MPIPLTIQELAAPVRDELIKRGFEPSDAAERAICGSVFLPECGAEVTLLARLAGVRRATVATWVANARAIQQERLELLGEPSNILVFIAPDGNVCCDKTEAVEAAAR